MTTANIMFFKDNASLIKLLITNRSNITSFLTGRKKYILKYLAAVKNDHYFIFRLRNHTRSYNRRT